MYEIFLQYTDEFELNGEEDGEQTHRIRNPWPRVKAGHPTALRNGTLPHIYYRQLVFLSYDWPWLFIASRCLFVSHQEQNDQPIRMLEVIPNLVNVTQFSA